MRIVILFHIDRDSKLPFKFNLAANAANYYCIAKLHRGNHSPTIPFGHLTNSRCENDCAVWHDYPGTFDLD